jgi:hypothetical protein
MHGGDGGRDEEQREKHGAVGGKWGRRGRKKAKMTRPAKLGYKGKLVMLLLLAPCLRRRGSGERRLQCSPDAAESSEPQELSTALDCCGLSRPINVPADGPMFSEIMVQVAVVKEN